MRILPTQQKTQSRAVSKSLGRIVDTGILIESCSFFFPLPVSRDICTPSDNSVAKAPSNKKNTSGFHFRWPKFLKLPFSRKSPKDQPFKGYSAPILTERCTFDKLPYVKELMDRIILTESQKDLPKACGIFRIGMAFTEDEAKDAVESALFDEKTRLNAAAYIKGQLRTTPLSLKSVEDTAGAIIEALEKKNKAITDMPSSAALVASAPFMSDSRIISEWSKLSSSLKDPMETSQLATSVYHSMVETVPKAVGQLSLSTLEKALNRMELTDLTNLLWAGQSLHYLAKSQQEIENGMSYNSLADMVGITIMPSDYLSNVQINPAIVNALYNRVIRCLFTAARMVIKANSPLRQSFRPVAQVKRNIKYRGKAVPRTRVRSKATVPTNVPEVSRKGMQDSPEVVETRSPVEENTPEVREKPVEENTPEVREKPVFTRGVPGRRRIRPELVKLWKDICRRYGNGRSVSACSPMATYV